jgi:hypothetical protein
VYNIQKVVSRLDYAPKLKEIQLTDIKKGLGVFTRKPDNPVSFAALKATLKKAGYTLDSADITITGKLVREGDKRWIVADPTGRRFALEGATVDRVLAGAIPDTEVEITGDWKTVADGASSREVVAPQSMKKAESVPKAAAVNMAVETPCGEALVRFEHASFAPVLSALPSVSSIEGVTKPLAPIRTTSPGLTVYQGGAVTPRLYLIKQHLGNLDVSRQLLDVSVSYTPSPRL